MLECIETLPGAAYTIFTWCQWTNKTSSNCRTIETSKAERAPISSPWNPQRVGDEACEGLHKPEEQEETYSDYFKIQTHSSAMVGSANVSLY
jgi:hypothetical protein